jgi:hypothetical protein
VIFLLPVILALLILGAMRGGTNLVLVLPMLLFLAGGVVAMTIADRDMKKRRSRSVHVLPTDHLSRKMRSALGLQRPTRPSGKPRSLSTRGPWRRPGPRRLPDDAA